MQLLTGVCDRETVGGLQVVNVVVEMEGFLRRILVGVVQLDGEPEGAVLLHRGAHEQSSYRGGREKNVTWVGARICSFPAHMPYIFPPDVLHLFIYFDTGRG